MITGGVEDDEDDIQPTLLSDSFEGQDPKTPMTASRGCTRSCHSAIFQDNTNRSVKPESSAQGAYISPCVKNRPGFDNSSFELGEEVLILSCCKLHGQPLRHSSSFSSSKLTSLSLQCECGHSPSQLMSAMPLPPSPLALEDSAFRMRTLSESCCEGWISPTIGTNCHKLSVPPSHSFHSRSPSPSRAKQVTLALPIFDQTNLKDHFQVSPSHRKELVSKPLHIPHTLSVDSAFLACPHSPNLRTSSESFSELYAGCKPISPLPSPRNSQQTLPSMFVKTPLSNVNRSVDYTPSCHPVEDVCQIEQNPPKTLSTHQAHDDTHKIQSDKSERSQTEHLVNPTTSCTTTLTPPMSFPSVNLSQQLDDKTPHSSRMGEQLTTFPCTDASCSFDSVDNNCVTGSQNSHESSDNHTITSDSMKKGSNDGWEESP